MKRNVCFVALAILFVFAASAIAEPRTYTYGGSGDDYLSDIAVRNDGLILLTGNTNSTDGTLSNRTKSGRSGWALCVDRQGNVLWSFCTRLGTQDRLISPVFQNDDTVTVMLQVLKADGERELELIRLNMSGDVVTRKTVVKGDCFSRAVEAGYLIGEPEKDDSMEINPLRYLLCNWDGETRELQGWVTGGWEEPMTRRGYVSAHSSNHLIRFHENQLWLTAFDALGNETLLTAVSDIEMYILGVTRFHGMVSLEDGGAAASGLTEDNGIGKGRLARWDAQGNTIFDRQIDDSLLGKLARTAKGFVAAQYTEEANEETVQLAFYDELGVSTGSIPLGHGTYGDITAVATLPDGGIAAVFSSLPNMDADSSLVNPRLIIIPQEDIP